jgi:DNA excision repair protein ERCC-3
VKLIRDGYRLLLISEDPALIAEIVRHKKMLPYIEMQLDTLRLQVNPAMRGHIKQLWYRLATQPKTWPAM